MEDAGRSYERGLAYLAAAKRMLAAARKLDEDDREHVRKIADGFVGKGTTLLRAAVRPARRGAGANPPPPESGAPTAQG